MEKETEQWPEKLRFNIQTIGFVGAIITSYVYEESWWSHVAFMFLLLLGPIVHLLVTPIRPTEFHGRSLCEKLAIMLLAFSWGHDRFWVRIWCDFVAFVIIVSNWIYELHKVIRPSRLHSKGLETRKAEAVDENKKELEVEEAHVMEEKKDELKVEAKPEGHKELDETCSSEEQKPENQNKLELNVCNLIDRHLSKFSEEIIKPVKEKLEAESNLIDIYKQGFERIEEELEAELNHNAFYKSEFEKMRENFEEKEREFEKMKAKFEEKERELESEKMKKENSFEEKEREFEKMKEKFEEKERELESKKMKEKSFDEKAREFEKMKEKFEAGSNHNAFYKRQFEKMKEKFEAESNHHAFYKRQFEKTKEKFEEKERELESEKMKENSFKEKEREFKKTKDDLDEQIKKLKEQLQESKICESRDYHHYSSLVEYFTEKNISLEEENSELKSKVRAMSELEYKIAGLELHISDLKDELYISYSKPGLLRMFDDDCVD